MNFLYCIKHEKMVPAVRMYFNNPEESLRHMEWVSSSAGEPFEDGEYCEFPDGWATCPPPASDLDEYIERIGVPPAIIEDDFLPYTYDVERDEIMEEVL